MRCPHTISWSLNCILDIFDLQCDGYFELQRELTYDTVREELLKTIGELETKKETEALSTRIPELLSHLESCKQKAFSCALRRSISSSSFVS